jgi:hypothetical protein
LFPQLYRKLSLQGLPDVGLRVYQGVYRHNWYKNVLTLDALGRIADELVSRDIEYLLYGSAALTLAYYKDFGARPITVLNLLCARESLEVTVGILYNLGWVRENPDQCFRDAQGRKLTLQSPSDVGLNDVPHQSDIQPFKGLQLHLLDLETHSQLLLCRNCNWDIQSSLLWITDFVRMFPCDNARRQLLCRNPQFKAGLRLIEAILGEPDLAQG